MIITYFLKIQQQQESTYPEMESTHPRNKVCKMRKLYPNWYNGAC